MKRWSCLFLLLILLVPSHVQAQEGSANYIYDEFEHAVPAPPAYTLTASLTARNFPEINGLDKLTDAFVSDEKIMILGAQQLLILNHDFTFSDVITEYTNEKNEIIPLKNCSGITVAPNGDYYIAQSEDSCILHFASDHKLIKKMERPVIYGFEDVKYRPSKLVLDNAGRMYVVSKGMYEGILELNADGTFTRFFGVNEVRLTPWQLVWRVFATKEQRERQMLWLPSDFTNLCIDQDGFMYATLLPDKTEHKSVKRLNARGENIMKVPSDQHYPTGDEKFNESGFGIPTGPSHFIAVDTNPYGVYICLDATRSRVFAYNEDHRLLFTFGGRGDRKGYFRNPVDACFVGDAILVVDALAQSLDIFTPTRYGQALMNAVKYQNLYEYEEAAKYWQEALSYNHNLSLAYSGIGRTCLRTGEYEKAMEYLKLGNDRIYYDKAYEKVRNEEMREAFVPVTVTLLVLISGLVILKKLYKEKQRRRQSEK